MRKQDKLLIAIAISIVVVIIGSQLYSRVFCLVSIGSSCLSQSDLDFDGDGVYVKGEGGRVLTRGVQEWIAEEYGFTYSDKAFRDYAEVYQQDLLAGIVELERYKHARYIALKEVVEDGTPPEEVYARHSELLGSRAHWDQLVRHIDTKEELADHKNDLKPIAGSNALRGDQLLDNAFKHKLYYGWALPMLLCSKGPLRQPLEKKLSRVNKNSDRAIARHRSRHCAVLSEDFYQSTYEQHVSINNADYEHLEHEVVFRVTTVKFIP